MKKIFLTCVVTTLICMMTGCQQKDAQPSLDSRVQSLKETAELGTVEYTVKKIVKANDKQWYSVGSRRILFQTTAYLKAGVKLDGFCSDNVVVDAEKNVTVTLPHAQLLSFNMPIEEVTTVFEDYGFFRQKFNADEQNYILQLGENDIREDVPNLGILEDAERNASEVFTAMLKQLDYKNINVKFE